jgi:hypothetical protein
MKTTIEGIGMILLSFLFGYIACALLSHGDEGSVSALKRIERLNPRSASYDLEVKRILEEELHG